MRERTRRLMLGPALLGVGLWWTSTRAQAEEPPARPPPLPPLEVRSPPFTRHVDVGGGASLLGRWTSTETDDGPTSVRYPPALGLSLWARVDVLRYLRASAYVLRSVRDMELSPGALGLPGDPGKVTVYAYSLGIKLSPTLPLGPRSRIWVSTGIGWGRFELGRFQVAAPAGAFEVRERTASHAELPLGLGASFDVIRNWLAVELEVTGAFYLGERGDALRTGQAVDAAGKLVRVGPFPRIEATFVQTLGLSLLL